MHVLIATLFLLFIACVVYAGHSSVKDKRREAQQKAALVRENCLTVQHRREEIAKEIESLEKEASEIFTLYEISKDITQKQDERQAFAIFKDKLKETLTVSDCLYLNAESAQPEELKADADYFVFTLKEKRKVLGYLAFKGVGPQTHDKILILGHQFALALRRIKLYDEVEGLAITDSLTTVHTRRYFLQRFREELERSVTRRTKLAFLMIDVDHFKSFNDKYGHLAGDQILKKVAQLIKENVREIDIVGRYGGEEFCVVLPETSPEGVMSAAERIRSAVEKTGIKAYDAVAKATVSIGTAISPTDGHKVDGLIDKADWALYRAKKMGRNRVCAFGVYE